jgi:hypothetical protein
MRSKAPFAVPVLLALITLPATLARASGDDDKSPDQQSIDALQTRVNQAQPRQQFFLYAQLAHDMTELSLRQYAAGDAEKAAQMLKNIQQVATKIHNSVSDDNKRLKDAEILLRRTAFRLTEMLRTSSFEDRPLVEQTLAEVNKAQNDAMLQVFRNK